MSPLDLEKITEVEAQALFPAAFEERIPGSSMFELFIMTPEESLILWDPWGSRICVWHPKSRVWNEDTDLRRRYLVKQAKECPWP